MGTTQRTRTRTTMSNIELILKGRGKSEPISLSVLPTSTAEELYKHLAAQTKLNIHRLRITTHDKKTNDTLLWKDLGPQVSWRTVFLTEYFGPLVIHPLFYFHGHRLFYQYLPYGYASTQDVRHSKMQFLALAMVMLHYLKRELETIFVHRFSHATMPIFNLFKNSAHYWGLSGLMLAIPLYGPWYGASAVRGTLQAKDEFLFPMLGTWLFAEMSNLITHLILRSLRPANDPKRRAIPTGYGFDKITCPNYFFESVAWLAFTAMTMSPFSALFLAVSTGQMMIWAKKKHRNYKKEFGDKYPTDRWMMIPGVW